MGYIYRPKYKDRNGEIKESQIYWLKYYEYGKPIRESTESRSETEARRRLRIKEGNIAKGAPAYPKADKVTFKELADAVIVDYENNARDSLRDLKMRLERHILPFFGHARAVSIRPADIKKFINHRKKEDKERGIKAASNAEINRELAIIKRAFSLGIEDEKIFHKPKIRTLEENNVRQGFFEREQFENVRARLAKELRGLMTFYYITGWRTNEVLTLKWGQVDMKAGRVRLEAGTTKNDEARVFPFTEELRDVLEAQWKYTKKMQKGKGQIVPWVFHREGKRIKAFYRTWRTACRNSGTPGKIVHDFRRTAVRNLTRAGVPEEIAMKMTGHKTRSVFKRYNIVNDADLSYAARLLDGAGKDMGKDRASRQEPTTVSS